MSDNKPQTVYRKDYQKPDYQVDEVDLDFDIHDDITHVTSVMNIHSEHDRSGNVKPLVLDGDELNLVSLKINGKTLKPEDYILDDKFLTIPNPPEKFKLEVKTDVKQKENTQLQGLYDSDGIICTKCETEGFRRITFFPDRPDVMAKYTTTIRADKEKLPVMLSNGNFKEEGELEDGRHYSKWVDPHPKPSYLFAVVAGKLDHVKDNFKTMSGKDVSLNIYCEKGKGDKCDYAMDSLKRSMKWDEEKFGREYDLDIFNIVAVSKFNSGACENKSLNVFNDALVLANPETATDANYKKIESVVGHEYFHNWTGNRVTIKQWHDLSLKEGFTVYRDQEFSSDERSRAVQRIQDVSDLRAGQFPEDAGPSAHPIRPDSYISVRNIYTGTVYEKGAEVIRMQERLLGKEKFRKGTDLYFKRHDGKAITCDDFVKAMEDANSVDLAQFKRWYSQAGTPDVTAKGKYDAKTKTYELTLSQKTPATPDQPIKKDFVIPVEVGLLDKNGKDMPLDIEGKTSKVLKLTKSTQTFKFENVEEPPVLSANRGFTAPVNMNIEYSDKEYAHLMAHDSDLFNRWDAGQQYATKNMLQMVKDIQKGKEPKPDESYIKAIGSYLKDDKLDKEFVAEAMVLPSEKYIADQMDVIDVDAIHKARGVMQKAISVELKDELLASYEKNQTLGEYSYDTESMGKRGVKNTSLAYLSKNDEPKLQKMMVNQYYSAKNMTDRDSAIRFVVNSDSSKRKEILDDFYNRYKDESLVVDKWLSMQAVAPRADTLDKVKELMNHEGFAMDNPNKVRSLIGAFSAGNPVCFHAKDGSGYEFLADQMIKLDKINPQVAAKMLTPLSRWKKLDPERQELMKKQLTRIINDPELSSNSYEVVSKSLAMAKDDKVKGFAKDGDVKGFVSGNKGTGELAHSNEKIGKISIVKQAKQKSNMADLIPRRKMGR